MKKQKQKKSGKVRARISAKKNRVKRQNIIHMNNVLRKAIRKWDDPILSQVCIPVEKNDDLSFIKTMRRTLRACKDGMGIAAPQIGESKNVILWKNSLDATHVNIMINPIVVESGDNKLTHSEGCLSYPDFFAKIERSLKIKVRWMDEKWNEYIKTFEGRNAIVVQHEIDHLLGFCKVGDAYLSSKQPDKDVTAIA
jgi:peptide deformylase